MDQIITRFPPSPSGYLHIGGARTALFNWLYARGNSGKFIFRIEDTDFERSTQASVDAIIEALEWLGIDWDEGPYFQSQRLGLYQEYVQKLIDNGHAYYCNCSKERLDIVRKEATSQGKNPKYDGKCRNLGLKKSDDTAVRIAAPLTGVTVVDDLVKGSVVFQNLELDDFIIQRTNRTPTYNFAVVVDDIAMNVNTIIRGDDHLSNTPKQIILYRAFGSPLPKFGHVPMVLGPDKTRLSKRHGAMSVTAYRDMGYLADALINYLVRLGWSHGDQEFFTRKDLIQKFNLENIGKSAGIFNPEKLTALNAEHIKASQSKDIAKKLIPFLKENGVISNEGLYIEKVIETLKPRSKTLKDMSNQALFYYTEDVTYDIEAAKKFLDSSSLTAIDLLTQEIENRECSSEKDVEDAFKSVVDKTGLKLSKIAQPIRVALTGKTASPGIFEIIDILGKEKVICRLKNAISFIKQK
ncbi:MAG: glutamate--tRNA ligase [Desulfobacterales bacterium]|nr:glutamate--tRNA ligase [Desulfobacterales bacterium]